MKKNTDINHSDSKLKPERVEGRKFVSRMLTIFIFMMLVILSVFSLSFIELFKRLENVDSAISNLNNNTIANSHTLSDISAAKNENREHFKDIMENNITHAIEQIIKNLEAADPTTSKFFFSFLNIENMIISMFNDVIFQPELFINKELVSNILNIANLNDKEKEIFLDVLNQKKKIKTYQKLQMDAFNILFNYINFSEKFFQNRYKKNNNSILDRYINSHIIDFLDNNVSINTQMPNMKNIEDISSKIAQKNFVSVFEDLKILGARNDYLLSYIDNLHKEFLETSAFLELLFNIRERYRFIIIEINTGVDDIYNIESFSDTKDKG